MQFAWAAPRSQTMWAPMASVDSSSSSTASTCALANPAADAKRRLVVSSLLAAEPTFAPNASASAAAMTARLEHCSPALRRCAGAPYAFLKYFRFLTSRIQTIDCEIPRNSLKAQDVANGTPIALLFAPVMYGSSSQHRASLINTGYPAEQPHQSDRLGAALKKREEPAGKPEIEAGEIVAALQLTGRPVTSEKPGATLSRVAFRISDHFFADTKRHFAQVSRVHRAYSQRRFLPERLLATG